MKMDEKTWELFSITAMQARVKGIMRTYGVRVSHALIHCLKRPARGILEENAFVSCCNIQRKKKSGAKFKTICTAISQII